MRAVAADQIVGRDALARAVFEIDDLGGDAGAGVLERLRAGGGGAAARPGEDCAKSRRIGSNQICEQACSRIGLHGSGVWRARRRPPHAAELVAGEARDEHRRRADGRPGTGS